MCGIPRQGGNGWGFNLPLPTSEEWSKYKTRTDNKRGADLERDKTRNGLERFQRVWKCHPFSSLGRWLVGALLQTHSSQHPSASSGGAG